MTRRAIILLPLLLSLAACDSGEPGVMSVREYEGDLGEAVIRQLIKSLPDPAPGVPKNYCVIFGEFARGGAPIPARTDFMRRFDDLNLPFVSATSLKESEPDHALIDQQSGLSPYLLQIRSMKSTSATTWDVEMGWAYKKTFERHSYKVELKDGKHTVISSERIEGNFAP